MRAGLAQGVSRERDGCGVSSSISVGSPGAAGVSWSSEMPWRKCARAGPLKQLRSSHCTSGVGVGGRIQHEEMTRCSEQGGSRGQAL